MALNRPSTAFSNKTDVNPSVNRQQEATAADFIEAGSLFGEYATAIETLQQEASANPYYGSYTTLANLQAAHTTALPDGWAIIDAGAGVTPQVAAWDDSTDVWELTGASAIHVFVNNAAALPATGEANKDYITLDTMLVRVWHNSEYKIKSPITTTDSWKLKIVKAKEVTINDYVDLTNGRVYLITDNTNITKLIFDVAFTEILKKPKELTTQTFYLPIYNVTKGTYIKAEITALGLIDSSTKMEATITGVTDAEITLEDTLYLGLPVEKGGTSSSLIKKTYSHSVQNFGIVGITTNEWNGIRAVSNVSEFRESTSRSNSANIVSSDLASIRASMRAPKDCYLSNLQITTNSSGSPAFLILMQDSSDNITVLHEVASINFNTNFNYDVNTTTVIPEGAYLYVLLKTDTTGFFGSFSFHVTEILGSTTETPNGINDAPADGNDYVRNNNAWVQDTGGSSTVLDEDDFASDSATEAPSQQSVKAYGDANWGGSSQEFNPPFALTSGNNEFVIVATGIARTSNTPSNGALITWGFIEDDSHDSSFFTSVEGDPASQGLIVKHPNVKSVMDNRAIGDETFVKRGVVFGARGEDGEAQYRVGRPAQIGGRLTGNGTTWTFAGQFASEMSVNSISSGNTLIDLNSDVYDIDAEQTTLEYIGTNNYYAKRNTSGISGGAKYGFSLYDRATDVKITTAPTTDDKVIISQLGWKFHPYQMKTWSTTGVYSNNEWLDGFANIWIQGVYELWLKVWIVSDTSLRAKWQTKTGVTTYKLYRDTNEDFSAETLIYSGTDLQYLDTGLTADTTYYYRLDDQTDTEISRFWNKTRLTAHQN